MADKKVLEEPALLRMLPVGQYEYVDATFAAADTDTVIPYTILKPEDFNDVRWIDVTPQTGKVYRAIDPNKVAWGQNYVILRSTVAGTTRLLLFLERS
jgi:hypothetical protein